MRRGPIWPYQLQNPVLQFWSAAGPSLGHPGQGSPFQWVDCCIRLSVRPHVYVCCCLISPAHSPAKGASEVGTAAGGTLPAGEPPQSAECPNFTLPRYPLVYVVEFGGRVLGGEAG